MIPRYSTDWFSQHIPVWKAVLSRFELKKRIDILEVGVFEGRSTNWLLENTLKGKDGFLYAVDLFEEQQEDDAYMGISTKTLLQKYHNNINKDPRVKIEKGNSHEILPNLIKEKFLFDIIYIDGDHTAKGTLEDLVDCFRLLKNEGIMIIDDYPWIHYSNKIGNPGKAVDAFLDIYQTELMVIHKGYQVIIKKTSSSRLNTFPPLI
jgi:predicted O-methyltransferase YrrM